MVKISIHFYRLLIAFFFCAVFSLSMSGAIAIYKDLHQKSEYAHGSNAWGTIKTLHGVPYIKVPGGWQKIHYNN